MKFSKELLKKLGIDKHEAQKTHLEVGFFKSAVYPDGQPVANVAYKNEFGHKQIPPRPFFRNCNRENQDKWIRFFNTCIIDGRGLEKSYNLLGEMIRSDIVKSITQLSEPPNSPATIKRKKSSNPLIDTGLMRSSVSYQIKRKD